MFAKINVKFTQVNVDSVKLAADLRAANFEARRLYITEFLEIAIKIIPVYSGMAQGALLIIGSLINMHWAITPAKLPNSNRHVANRVSEGQAASSAQFTDYINKKSTGVKLSFYTGVDHLVWNDVNRSSKPLKSITPWNAFEQARVAGQIAANVQLRKLKIKSYIHVSKGRISRSLK